jgi:hypothetical protein
VATRGQRQSGHVRHVRVRQVRDFSPRKVFNGEGTWVWDLIKPVSNVALHFNKPLPPI